MTCMAVPMPTGPYLRTWMVSLGKTSPVPKCRLDSSPLSLLGLGLILGEAGGGCWSPSLLGPLPSLYPLSSLVENACRIILRKLIQDINFF